MFQLENGFIDEEEYFFFLDETRNKKKNPVFPYWEQDKFSLDNWSDDECWADFRFRKTDLLRLCDALGLSGERVKTENRLTIDPMEALCLTLRRLAFPCRFSDLIPRFGRSVPDMSYIFNRTLDIIHNRFGRLLTSFNQAWLSKDALKDFADCIHAKGAPLDNCWGFIDGTLRGIARPGTDQKAMYSGHKRHHGYKMQSVSTPNGLIANLFGPIEGSRHDCYLLAQSGFMDILQRYSIAPDGTVLCVYGDPAYPHREQLQTGFKNPLLEEERVYNERMSSVRVSVEWVFGDVIERFKFTDYSKMQKIGLSAVSKQYIASALLSNARTCIYGSCTSTFFNCQPPTLEAYLSG